MGTRSKRQREEEASDALSSASSSDEEEKIEEGDIVEVHGSGSADGMRGTVVGWKDEFVRVQFTEGKKKVKPRLLRVVRKKGRETTKGSTSAGAPKVASTAPAASSSSSAFSSKPRQPRAPVEEFPSPINMAALNMMFASKGMGQPLRKKHPEGGTWLDDTPTEDGPLLTERQGCMTAAPWFRGTKGKPGWEADAPRNENIERAAQRGLKEFYEVMKASDEYTQSLARRKLGMQSIHDGDEMLRKVSGEQDSDEEQQPTSAPDSAYFVKYHGVWRRCVVMEKTGTTDEDEDVHRVWLLAKSGKGWEPDLRAGDLEYPVSHIAQKGDIRLDIEMRQAEIGEVTRQAIAAGDVFPSVPALERALINFPPCFKPDTAPTLRQDTGKKPRMEEEDDAKPQQYVVKKRFEVRSTIPVKPLSHIGSHPSWPEGGYIARLDQNRIFVPDTPTGGPLDGAPAWPVDATCLECGYPIDPAEPGEIVGGTVYPSFVARATPGDPTTIQYLHRRTCIFARKERDLARLEFHWLPNGTADKELFSGKPVTLSPLKCRTHLPPAEDSTDLPVDAPSEAFKGEEGEWWVGRKGIIHAVIDGHTYELLRIPSRKVVIGLSKDGKPVASSIPFNESDLPHGYTTAAHHARQGSRAFRKLARKEEVTQKAALQTEEEATQSEVEVPAPPVADLTIRQFAEMLTPECMQVLDKLGHMLTLKPPRKSGDTEGPLSEEEDSEDEEQRDTTRKDDDKLSSDSDEASSDSEIFAKENKLRPDAEDPGELSDSESERGGDAESIGSVDDPSTRDPVELSRFMHLTHLLEYLERMLQEEGEGLFSNVEKLADQLDSFIKGFANSCTAAAPGVETAFPFRIAPIEREAEWRDLQREWGAGLSMDNDNYFTGRFMTPPFTHVRQNRGIYKAIAYMGREKFEKLVLAEKLLLCRAMQRRLEPKHQQVGYSAKVLRGRPVPTASTSYWTPLRQLCLEQSLWITVPLIQARDIKAAEELANIQISSIGMIPSSRIEMALTQRGDTEFSATVRVKGLMETRREIVPPATAPSLRKEGARQLMQFVKVGELLLNGIGVARVGGDDGSLWQGAVGPYVTVLNSHLRGTYSERRVQANTYLDMRGITGKWMFKAGAQGWTALEDIIPGANILLDATFFDREGAGSTSCSCEVPNQVLEALLALREEVQTQESLPPGETTKVSVSFNLNSLTAELQIEEGAHVDEMVSAPLRRIGAVELLLDEAGIKRKPLRKAIREATCVRDTSCGRNTPRVSELYWLLLSAPGDRGTLPDEQIGSDDEGDDEEADDAPWRFHELFKGYGLSVAKARRLRDVVFAAIAALPEKVWKARHKVEVEHVWRPLVRLHMYEAWTRLNPGEPSEQGMEARSEPSIELSSEEGEGSDGEGKEQQDLVTPQQKRMDVDSEEESEQESVDIFSSAYSEMSTLGQHECTAHGPDLHRNGAVCNALRRILGTPKHHSDPAGKRVVHAALAQVRRPDGQVRYQWNYSKGMLEDTLRPGAAFIPQNIASEVAKHVRRFAQKVMVGEKLKRERTRDKEDDEDWEEESYSDDDSDQSEATAVSDWIDKDDDVEEEEPELDPFTNAATTAAEDMLPGQLCCRRCDVTIQNLHRFGNTLCNRLRNIKACKPQALEALFTVPGTSQAQSDVRSSLDKLILAAVKWAHAADVADASHPEVIEAEKKYTKCCQELWELAVSFQRDMMLDSEDEEDEGDFGPVAVPESDSGAASDDEEEELPRYNRDNLTVEKLRAEETQACPLGLCTVWNFLGSLCQVVSNADRLLRTHTNFASSLVAALQNCRVKDPIFDALQDITRTLDAKRLVNPDAEELDDVLKSLHVIRGTSFSHFISGLLKLLYGMASIETVTERLSLTKEDPLVARALVVMGMEEKVPVNVVPFTVDPLPWVYFEDCVAYQGDLVGRHTGVTTFVDALHRASSTKGAICFTWHKPGSENAGLLTVHGVKGHLGKTADGGALSCMLHEVREDLKDGKYRTWTAFMEKEGFDLARRAWRNAEEARRDPTDNQFRTKAEFLARHAEHGEEAWLDAEELRPDKPGGTQYKTQAQLIEQHGEGEGRRLWKSYAETRRAPTDKYTDYASYKAHVNTIPGDQAAPGDFKTVGEFVQHYGKDEGMRLWEEAEPRRLDPKDKKCKTWDEFVASRLTNAAQRMWNESKTDMLPMRASFDCIKRSRKEALRIYQLVPTKKQLEAMHREFTVEPDMTQESHQDFAQFARLHFPWISEVVAEVAQATGGEVQVIPRIGDFTAVPAFVFAVKAGFEKTLHGALAALIAGRTGIKSSAFSSHWDLSPMQLTWGSEPVPRDRVIKNIIKMRRLADRSRSLQWLYKNRAAAFPQCVFDVISELMKLSGMGVRGHTTPDRPSVEEYAKRFREEGAGRVLDMALRDMGHASIRSAIEAAEKSLTAITTTGLLVALSNVITSDWTKPFPPPGLRDAEDFAASSPLLPTEKYSKELTTKLKSDGASPIVEWAMRASLHTLRPLNIELRDMSLKVNVVRFTPLEIRVPSAKEIPVGGKVLCDIELFCDVNKYEQDWSREKAFGYVYIGDKANPRAVRYDQRLATAKVSLMDGELCQEKYRVMPIIVVLHGPARITSYRIRSRTVAQPVEWKVEAALLPFLEWHRTGGSRDDMDSRHVDWGFYHRWSDRLTQPVTEQDFLPTSSFHAQQWHVGDAVVVNETMRGTVTAIDDDFQPIVTPDKGGEAVTIKEPRDIKLRLDEESSGVWFGVVPPLPMMWSQRIQVRDTVPLVFTEEQRLRFPTQHKVPVTFWCAQEFVNPSPQPDQLARIIMTQKAFAFTRHGSGEGLVWEYGTLKREKTQIILNVSREGIPGGDEEMPRHKKIYGEVNPKDTKRIMLHGVRLERKVPKVLYVKCPLAHRRLTGVYDLIVETFNGEPVWRRRPLDVSYSNDSDSEDEEDIVDGDDDPQPVIFNTGVGKWSIAFSTGASHPPVRVVMEAFPDYLPCAASGEWESRGKTHAYKPYPSMVVSPTPCSLETQHIVEYLERFGVGEDILGDWEVNPYDEDELMEEVEEQIEMRHLEAHVADLYDGVRILTTVLLKLFDHCAKGWEEGWKAADTVYMEKLQALWYGMNELRSAVGEVAAEDDDLVRNAVELEEETARGEAGMRLMRKGYPPSLVMWWAAKRRAVEAARGRPDQWRLIMEPYTSGDERLPPTFTEKEVEKAVAKGLPSDREGILRRFDTEAKESFKEADRVLWKSLLKIPDMVDFAVTTLDAIIREKENPEAPRFSNKWGMDRGVFEEGIKFLWNDWCRCEVPPEPSKKAAKGVLVQWAAKSAVSVMYSYFVEEHEGKNETAVRSKLLSLREKLLPAGQQLAQDLAEVWKEVKASVPVPTTIVGKERWDPPGERDASHAVSETQQFDFGRMDRVGIHPFLTRWDTIEYGEDTNLNACYRSFFQLTRDDKRVVWPHGFHFENCYPSFSTWDAVGHEPRLVRIFQDVCHEHEDELDDYLQSGKEAQRKSRHAATSRSSQKWMEYRRELRRQYLKRRAIVRARKKRDYRKSAAAKIAKKKWKKQNKDKYRQTEAAKEAKKRAKQTEAAKEAKKRAKQSDAAKAAKREYNKLYRSTPEGKAKEAERRRQARARRRGTSEAASTPRSQPASE